MLNAVLIAVAMDTIQCSLRNLSSVDMHVASVLKSDGHYNDTSPSIKHRKVCVHAINLQELGGSLGPPAIPLSIKNANKDYDGDEVRLASSESRESLQEEQRNVHCTDNCFFLCIGVCSFSVVLYGVPLILLAAAWFMYSVLLYKLTFL